LALDPLEWGVIAVMGIAVFIWGPEKVPQIARQLGQARRELETATKQLQGMSKELQGVSKDLGGSLGQGSSLESIIGGLIPGLSGNPEPATLGAPTAPAPNAAAPQAATASSTSNVVSGDRLLIDMARKLGISTPGKTRDDIQNEIVTRASRKPAQATVVAPVNAPVVVPSEQVKPVPEQPTAEQPTAEQQPAAG